MRNVLSILFGAATFTGCFFPSFDGMQSDQNPTLPPHGGANAPGLGGDAAVPMSGDAGPATGGDPAANPADDASVGASSVDAATKSPGAGFVSCAGTACTPGGFCCAGHNGGTSSCGEPNDPAGEGACKFPGGGVVLKCDENDDCSAGQVCCLLLGDASATCRHPSACPSVVLCNPQAPSCPAGLTCTGSQALGGGHTSSFCK
jgi:hypothetical protein